MTQDFLKDFKSACEKEHCLPLDETPCCASLPEHHVRYARAWTMHQDADMSDSAREILEREMDAAQNLFGWDEFQEFKVTLPGFVVFWAGWNIKLLSLHKNGTQHDHAPNDTGTSR